MNWADITTTRWNAFKFQDFVTTQAIRRLRIPAFGSIGSLTRFGIEESADDACDVPCLGGPSGPRSDKCGRAVRSRRSRRSHPGDLPQTPVEVSAVKENGLFRLRTTEISLALYTYDQDAEDRSACVGT